MPTMCIYVFVGYNSRALHYSFQQSIPSPWLDEHAKMRLWGRQLDRYYAPFILTSWFASVAGILDHL